MNQLIMLKMMLTYDVTNIAFTNEEKTECYTKTLIFLCHDVQEIMKTVTHE